MKRTSTLARQAFALTSKNIRIAAIRHWAFTLFRAFILPVAFIGFLSYAKNLFIPDSTYGYGNPAPIQDLATAIDPTRKLVFVNNNLGSDVDNLIDRISAPVRQAGKEVIVLDNEVGLLTTCKQSLLGASKCYGAVVFNDIPSTSNNTWNYTLRADGQISSSGTVKVRKDKLPKWSSG